MSCATNHSSTRTILPGEFSRIGNVITPLTRQLKSFHHLADWLEVSPSELHWLVNADRRRQGARQRTDRHYTSHWIRKRSCGWRLLESPRPKLKLAQRKILSEILDTTTPHPLAFGFRKGCSVLDFARPHVNRAACLKLDLEDFFPTITTRRVYGLFRTFGFNASLAHALANLTTVRTDLKTIEVVAPLVRTTSSAITRMFSQRHLPQGAPTSPAIANLCARGLDGRLAGLARRIGGVHYSRYADDILMSGDADFARQAKRLRILAGAIAIEEGFRLNFRKSRLMHRGNRQTACGLVLNDRMNVSRKSFDQLKAVLHNCVRTGAKAQNRESHPHFRQHLAGRIEWISQTNEARGNKLRAMFDQIDFDS